MTNSLEGIFRGLAYRRALRAIHRVQKSSWYMGKLLGNRLAAGLATPTEIMASAWSWRGGSK